MKKLVLILALLLAVETYGVYGRSQADRIMYTCEAEVGPLCYYWKQNALGKLIGEHNSEDLEEKLEKARKAWEDDFVDRLARGAEKKNSLEKALEHVGDALNDLKDAFEK